MNTKKLLNVVFSAVIACAVSIPLARANEADQLTKVTFGEAVEIPGKDSTCWQLLVRSGGGHLQPENGPHLQFRLADGVCNRSDR